MARRRRRDLASSCPNRLLAALDSPRILCFLPSQLQPDLQVAPESDSAVKLRPDESSPTQFSHSKSH